MLYCTCIKSLYHFVSTKDLGIHHLGVLGQCANEHCSLKEPVLQIKWSRDDDVLPHAAQLGEAAWHEGVAMGDVF